MTADQIQRIVSKGLFPGKKTGVSLIETHISWVILTDEFAYKIKKPLRFDFLDFSTPELRRHFCEEELRLNRRLAPQMYIAVLPVGADGIGSETAPVTDHALQMHRMDNTRELDKLLAAGTVPAADMGHLAALLAVFHQKNRLPSDGLYDPEQDARDFAGLFAFEADLTALQAPDVDLLHHWTVQIPAFLHAHAARSQARIRSGFRIEGHGDLHSRNILLPRDAPPVVFDCLEFNEHFRQMDVLNELAFLCMDLEFFGRKDLSEAFLKAYSQHWNCLETPEDRLLFTYFKAYRANVRLKVVLLELRQRPDEKRSATALAYWSLLRQYCGSL